MSRRSNRFREFDADHQHNMHMMQNLSLSCYNQPNAYGGWNNTPFSPAMPMAAGVSLGPYASFPPPNPSFANQPTFTREQALQRGRSLRPTTSPFPSGYSSNLAVTNPGTDGWRRVQRRMHERSLSPGSKYSWRRGSRDSHRPVIDMPRDEVDPMPISRASSSFGRYK
jgi:hypothetical protein